MGTTGARDKQTCRRDLFVEIYCKKKKHVGARHSQYAWLQTSLRLATSLRDKANLLCLLSLSKRRLAQPVSTEEGFFFFNLVLMEKPEWYKGGLPDWTVISKTYNSVAAPRGKEILK